jgi:hypothetical protein
MSSPTPRPTASPDILKGALISGAINAVINGGIQFFLLRGSESIPLSVDAIGSDTHTVFSAAVPLAVSLAMILTAVSHWTLKADKIAFFPTTAWLVVKHGLFAFGLLVVLGVMWQRLFGTVEVGLMTAVIFLGIVAGVVAALVNYLTISEIVRDKK